jgi:hypothetical protein
MTIAAPAPEQDSARPSKVRWLAPLAMFLVVGTGAAITLAVVSGDDQPASAASFAQVEGACGDWMSSAESGSASDDQWCTDMFAWMSDRSGGSMMGSMMWQGSERMEKTCREWVSQDRGETGAADAQRCHDMVQWMDRHMSSQDGTWMMRGH